MTVLLVTGGGHIQLFSRTVDAEVCWRLLSGNNRETGRGATGYPDAEACRIGLKELQSTVDEMQGRVRRVGANEWGWRIFRGEELIAMSGRGFDRMIRCEQGLAYFLEHLRVAEIGPNVMVSHARRW